MGVYCVTRETALRSIVSQKKTTKKVSNTNLELRKMDLLERRFYGREKSVGFPYNYHNSFWSNYLTNYWHPSSYYYNQLFNPDPVEIIPGYYQYYDPFLPKMEASENIRSRSKQLYSNMIITKNYPMLML